jgi:hypothetical protein
VENYLEKNYFADYYNTLFFKGTFMNKLFYYIITGLIFCGSLVRGDEFNLSLNMNDQYAISEIITAMGEKNIAGLLFDAFRLRRLGDSIQHVPPLQFLGFVLSNPHLKDCLKKISKSSFKWTPFIEGFSQNMEKELIQGKLLIQLHGFSELTKGSLDQLEGYAYQQEWDKFVKCLL